jgi:hypothetical protein
MLREGGNTETDRIRFAFRLCTARDPDQSDVEILTRALQLLRSQYKSDPTAAAKWLAHGETPLDTTLNTIELAAHAALCSLILNMDETLSKE